MTPEGRAPRPTRGDPNMKMISVSLSPEEWRKLRMWAAEEDSSMDEIVDMLVRRALAPRPNRTY